MSYPSDDDVVSFPAVNRHPDWDEPKELVITIDGEVKIQRMINGYYLGQGTQQCSNDGCVHCLMPDAVVVFAALCAPPVEATI